MDVGFSTLKTASAFQHFEQLRKIMADDRKEIRVAAIKVEVNRLQAVRVDKRRADKASRADRKMAVVGRKAERAAVRRVASKAVNRVTANSEVDEVSSLELTSPFFALRSCIEVELIRG
jgi:hypothetical protein